MYNCYTPFWEVILTTTVIYADSLMLVNFSIDFLALFLTARLRHFPIKQLRLVLSALLGAAAALFFTVAETYNPDISPILKIFSILISAAVMAATAFGSRGVVKSAFTYMAVNMGLGGCMTAVYGLVGRLGSGITHSALSADTNSLSPTVFLVITAISAVLSLVYTKFRDKSLDKRSATAVLRAFGREITLELLCDSGDLLCDPFLKKPVVIVSANYIKDSVPAEILEAAKDVGIAAALPCEYAHTLRLIPARSVCGEGMLLGFTPDSLTVDGNSIDAVVAIDVSSDGYDGFAGIIPQKLA